MEFWQVQCRDENDADQPAHHFRHFNDIRTSLLVSYSRCDCLDVVKSPEPTGGPVYTVTGFVPGTSEPFKHTFKCTRLVIYDAPTHL